MRSDVEIRHDGFRAIFENMEIVEAERFIALLRRDHFDYTKWRKDLFSDVSVEKLAEDAANYWEKKYPDK